MKFITLLIMELFHVQDIQHVEFAITQNQHTNDLGGRSPHSKSCGQNGNQSGVQGSRHACSRKELKTLNPYLDMVQQCEEACTTSVVQASFHVTERSFPETFVRVYLSTSYA